MKKTTPTPLPPLTRSARIHNHPRITRLLLVLSSNPPLILLAALFRAHLAIFPVIKYSLSTIFTVNRLDGSSTVSNPSFWRWSDMRVCVRVCDRMGRRGMKRMHDDSLDGRGTGWLLFSISRKRTSEGFEWFSTWRWSFWMLGDVSRNLAWKRFALGWGIRLIGRIISF